MHTSDKDKVPGRTDKQPPVVAAVLIVFALGIDEQSAYKQEQPVLQKT